MKKLLLFMGFAFSLTINAQVPSYVPTNGLVGYWSFTGNANDISGNSNNGTNNGATLTTDRFGNPNSAYSFNGSSFIAIPHNTIYNMQKATWNVWVKSNVSTSGNGRFIFGKRDNASHFVTFYERNGNGGQEIGWTSGSATGYLATSINGSWHMLTMTYDLTITSNNYKFYFDGVFVGAGDIPTSFIFNNGDLRFGVQANSTYFQGFNGLIDDASIFNRILTTTEITSLYQTEISCQSLVINSGTLSSFNPPVYQSTITIYPNPANDQITIDCGNLANVVGYHLEIVNTLGQVVFNQPMNTQQYTIALNTWTGTGIYFVKIYDASNNLLNTKKIILQ